MVPAPDGKALLRTMVLRGGDDNLYFWPGESKGLTVQVTAPADAANSAGKPMRVRFENGESHLTVQYQW
jgi:hypothetical protein